MDEAARLVGDAAIQRVKARRAGHKSDFIRRDAFAAARLVVNRSGQMLVCGFGTGVFYRTARLVVNRSSQMRVCGFNTAVLLCRPFGRRPLQSAPNPMPAARLVGEIRPFELGQERPFGRSNLPVW